jgi:hypothetical protein
MPRTPRNPGSGKAPYNGPAQGAGTGGAAKGVGSGPAQPFTPDSHDPAVLEREHALNHDAGEQAYRAEQRKLNRERRKKAWEVVEETMADPGHKDRYAAAKDTLDRIEGRATQKTEVSGPGGGPITLESLVTASLQPPKDT